MSRIALIAGMCVTLAASAAWGQLVIQHVGANDPETEGWGQNYYDYNGNWSVEARPLASDPAFPGVAAWQIEADNGEIAYTYDLTPEVQTQASAEGWTLTGTWRMEWCDENQNFQGGNWVSLRLADGWFGPRMGYGDTTDDRAAKIVGPGNPVVDLGPDGYHTVTTVYDPAEGMVDVYANGTWATEMTTGELSINRVYFGGANAGNANDGINNYSLVRFEIGMHIPEPDTCSPGDADGDSDVDDDDLGLLLANWGSETADCGQGEFSAVPPVNDDDLSLLLANWTGPLAAVVPEPATLAILALGALALRRRRT